MKWYCSPDVNITPVPSPANSTQPQPNTVLIKRTNNNQVFTRPLPPQNTQPLPLTSPTAIQINEAVNKISASSAPIDIDKLQLPPGITITKLDPCDYKPPRDIQQSTEKVSFFLVKFILLLKCRNQLFSLNKHQRSFHLPHQLL